MLETKCLPYVLQFARGLSVTLCKKDWPWLSAVFDEIRGESALVEVTVIDKGYLSLAQTMKAAETLVGGDRRRWFPHLRRIGVHAQGTWTREWSGSISHWDDEGRLTVEVLEEEARFEPKCWGLCTTDYIVDL